MGDRGCMVARETASEGGGGREARGKRWLADKIRVRNRGASGCGNVSPPSDTIATLFYHLVSSPRRCSSA